MLQSKGEGTGCAMTNKIVALSGRPHPAMHKRLANRVPANRHASQMRRFVVNKAIIVLIYRKTLPFSGLRSTCRLRSDAKDREGTRFAQLSFQPCSRVRISRDATDRFLGYGPVYLILLVTFLTRNEVRS